MIMKVNNMIKIITSNFFFNTCNRKNQLYTEPWTIQASYGLLNNAFVFIDLLIYAIYML